MAEKFYWTIPSSLEKFFIRTPSRYNMHIELKIELKRKKNMKPFITNYYTFTKILYNN